MKNRTLQALRGSIRNWEENAQIKNLDHVTMGYDACPLCRVFLRINATCDGCPIKEKTGAHGCRKTPYPRAHRAVMKGRLDLFLKAARDEVAFLKSLLPVKEDQPDAEIQRPTDPVLPPVRGD